VALDCVPRPSQHHAIRAANARLVEQGRVPGMRHHVIAAEEGVIQDPAARAVFKLRSGGLFGLGEEEGRDWRVSGYQLSVPHRIRIRVSSAREDGHTACDTHGLSPTEVAFLRDDSSAAMWLSLFPSTISNIENCSGSEGRRNGAALQDVGR
jgi:hypothetical protein